MVEPRLHQHEFVAARELGQLAPEQPHPRQRLGMAGQRIRHRLVEPCQSGLVWREIHLPLLHPRAQQGERPEQAARAGIFRELAEKGLGVDHPVDQPLELFGVEEEKPFILEEG